MLKADKNNFILWGFTRFNRKFLKHHFHNIYVKNSTKKPMNKRTLFMVNHSSWWDSLVIFFLNEQIIRSDAYGMMHEEGIRRFPFFRKIGMYSINTDDRKHLLESLRYSVDLLHHDKTVWIFPQGEEQHLEKRPLGFYSGASYISQKVEQLSIVQVSIYYSMEHHKKPNLYIHIGPPLKPEAYANYSRKARTQLFEDKATNQLDQLKQCVIAEDHKSFINYGRE
ncbi:lysophospholipid acyltransferase family protein [Halobacillus campisalis]|uniref:Lysophospholipid acyltransferase family protein n=1 Tax=Halobacillus campisalis TaxID=435909 RepID=A0ABW2K3P0_9BACI|nr:lysophospholipid acyltransferase family protein [Halobacillus campisalis]